MRIALAPPSNRARLWVEFTLLFIGVPVLMAATFGQYSLFLVIWVLAAVAAALLAITPGFEWRLLLKGPVLGEWRLIAGFTAFVALICLGFVFTLRPDQFLAFALGNPLFWAVVMVGYPLLSALPQEVIYRSLFFERYGPLFGTRSAAILVNGAVFGFGHLFFMNWVTITLTAIGGAFMGWAYLRARSMMLAWVLHGIAGQLIFTLGLGIYFYHGMIGR